MDPLPTGVNPNWPLCHASPFMNGPLASFPASSLIFSSSSRSRPYRTRRFMSVSLNRLHGFILPCLCSYLGFSLVHHNTPHSPGELFILQMYLECHPSEKLLVTHSSGVDHSLFSAAIVLNMCFTYSRVMICFLDPVSFCEVLRAGIVVHFCIKGT